MDVRTALLATLISLVAAGQAPPQFEVASVKANTSGDGKVVLQTLPGGRFTAANVTLRQLIQHAYQLKEFQITGGPNWLARDRFDVVAKAEGAEPRVELMLRTLLAERFGLAVHIETKELPIYALMLVRSDGALGPEMKHASGGCGLPDRSACDLRVLPGIITAGHTTLTELAGGLSTMVNRVVVDRTGLADHFAFTLRWTPDQLSPGLERKARAMGLSPIDPDGPALFTAVKEQLGLKLDAQKGPVDTLVVDRAERPKEN